MRNITFLVLAAISCAVFTVAAHATPGQDAQAALKAARAQQRAAQVAYNESPAGIAEAKAKAERAVRKAEQLKAKTK